MKQSTQLMGAMLIIFQLALLISTAPTADAQSTLVRVETNTRLLNCGSTSNQACTEGSRSLPAGRTVKPLCKISGDHQVGGRGWAFVRTVRGSEGFAPIVRLQQMPQVPHCSTVPRVEAMMFAARQLGDRYADQSITSRHSTDWTPGPFAEWSGDCMFFARVVYDMTGGPSVLSGPSAMAVANRYSNQLSTSDRIPAGAIMFWDIDGNGHAALSLGRGGLAVGTLGVDWEERPVSVYDTSVYSGYLGWVVP